MPRGARQTSRNEVSYDNGKFVVTYALPGTRVAAGVADCPGGWFCFYEDVNFGYPRGKLSDCGTQDLGAWGWSNRVSSADNGLPETIIYKTFAEKALFRTTSHQSNPWVGPDANDKARYVERACY